MNKKIIMLRHAKSLHNIKKQQLKQKIIQKNYKNSEEYQHLKYDLQLIDKGIINSQVCLRHLTQMMQDKTQLIIVSPLKRCLQTAQILRKYNSNIRVIVQPLLTTRINSSWSIGSQLSNLKEQHPHFDFKLVQQLGKDWMNTIFKQSNVNIIHFDNIKQSNNQGKIINFLKNGLHQSYYQFYKRIHRAYLRIHNIIIKESPKLSKVIIISHSCVLNLLLGKQYSQKGKIKNKQIFQHCMPFQISLQEWQQKNIKNIKYFSKL